MPKIPFIIWPISWLGESMPAMGLSRQTSPSRHIASAEFEKKVNKDKKIISIGIILNCVFDLFILQIITLKTQIKKGSTEYYPFIFFG